MSVCPILVPLLLSFGAFAQSAIQTQLGSAIWGVVAKDGSGQYSTVQAAVNAFPANNTSPKVIFVKKGTYTEKVEIASNKTNMVLVGEDAAATIIAYGDYSGSGKLYNGIITNSVGVAIGTSTSHTLYAAANDFTMMNITIKNTAGDVGQAVAFNTNGDRHFLYHCKLIGYQDTYYTWSSGRVYAKDTYIEGAIDYIFGRAVALFDSCQLHSVRSSSYITAASTEQNFKFGYVFNNCKLTSPSGLSNVFLGRPWKAYCRTVFMNSEIGSFLSSAGWSAWSGTTNDQTCYYAEYKNCGAGSGTSNRVSWSHQLTATQAATYTKTNIFDKSVNPSPYAASWNPTPETDPIYNVIKRNTTRFITSACFSSNCTAQTWYKDSDGDGKGDPNTTVSSCTQPTGYVADKTDLCPNDANKIAPGQCGCGVAETTCVDCQGLKNGTAVLDNCGRCVAGTSGKTACTAVGEAEADACSFDGVTEAKNTGFKGTAYLNVDNAIGTAITFSVSATTAGSAVLSFRYSNGGTVDRPAQISLNGVVLSNTLSFPVTGDFNTWKTVDLSLTLIKGLNTLKLISSTVEGLSNIDQIGYVSAGLSKGNCVVTGTLDSKLETLNLNVFPNPFAQHLSIRQSGQFTYQILNLEGKEMESGQATDYVELGSQLLPSLYLLKIQSEQGSKTLKISKTK